MTARQGKATEDTGADNTIKNPEDWKTGDEPATGAQLSYINTMSDEAGLDAPQNLSKAEAAKLIEDLQTKTGRGQGT